MIFKRSTLLAIVTAWALAGFGSAAFAGDKAAAPGNWAPPNTVGMPGYKEPPKQKGDANLPIAVPSVDASSHSYHQKMGTDAGNDKNDKDKNDKDK